MLAKQFNKESRTQRNIYSRNLFTVKPRSGERISAYCERLQQYCDLVDGAKEAIGDSVLLHAVHHRQLTKCEYE